MTDHNDAPDEHTPEGAIPTSDDSTAPESDGPAPETMIGEGTVTIDADEVEETIEQIDDAIGEGEPLPVGAHDPETKVEEPSDPPGMPHEPDDLDREMAARAHEEYLRQRSLPPHPDRVRLDQATIPDVLGGRTILDLRAHSVREALLRQIGEMAEGERRALREYADALRTVQEARDGFVHYRDARLGAAEALFVLGMDVEGDHAKVEPTPETIPDHLIV